MIVAGFGFRAGATKDSLKNAYDRLGGGADLLPASFWSGGFNLSTSKTGSRDLLSHVVEDTQLTEARGHAVAGLQLSFQ